MQENASYEFPKGFLWGAATSAHQVEGNNHNDWTEWEQKSAKDKVESAKAKKWPVHILGRYPSPLQKENYISRLACDHYNRFREDVDLARSLGHNAHRFSIEWSRIEPEEGVFDEKEIAHYREVLAALHGRGMEPFVTLWHWTLPLWVRDEGGWGNKKTIGYFLRYVEKLCQTLGKDIAFWMPLNEPGIYIGLGYLQAAQPPFVKSLHKANTVFKHLMAAYRGAYAVIHAHYPASRVGLSHYAAHVIPYKNGLWNKVLASALNYFRNGRFLNAVKNTNDFIGIQYYHTDFVNLKLGGRFGFFELKNPNTWLSDMGWQIYPEGIYYVVKQAARYKKPIYITENGVADARDVHRERFIKEHLQWVCKAIQEGADVRGYFYWSLLDNFEMPRLDGFWPRFGLCEVDYKTMERRVRPSALAYKRICETNSL